LSYPTNKVAVLESNQKDPLTTVGAVSETTTDELLGWMFSHHDVEEL
jgi:hypothetical protein